MDQTLNTTILPEDGFFAFDTSETSIIHLRQYTQVDTSLTHNKYPIFARASNYIITYLDPTLFTFGIIGNLITFVVFLKNSNHHTALFLTALAASDLGQNISYLVANKIMFLEFEHKYATCQCIVFLLSYFVTNSTWQVTIMTMEKFIAVRFPFKFRKFRSRKIVVTAISIGFFSSALVTFPMIFAAYVGDGSTCNALVEKTQFNVIYAWLFWILQFFIPLSTMGA